MNIEPSIAIACSGPGAMERIEAAEQLGHLTLLVTFVVLVAAAVVLCVRARRLRKSAIGLLVLGLLHPGLWLGARHGDCGMLLEQTAWPATIGAFVVAAMAVVLTERARRRAAAD